MTELDLLLILVYFIGIATGSWAAWMIKPDQSKRIAFYEKFIEQERQIRARAHENLRNYCKGSIRDAGEHRSNTAK